MSPILTLLLSISVSIGLVTATPVLKSAPSPIAMAAAAETTDPNNVPGPMFCAPEVSHVTSIEGFNYALSPLSSVRDDATASYLPFRLLIG